MDDTRSKIVNGQRRITSISALIHRSQSCHPQGLQSVGGRGKPRPETETDGGAFRAGRRGAEAGTTHPEVHPGHETHERVSKQPEISFCSWLTHHPKVQMSPRYEWLDFQ